MAARDTILINTTYATKLVNIYNISTVSHHTRHRGKIDMEAPSTKQVPGQYDKVTGYSTLYRELPTMSATASKAQNAARTLPEMQT